MQCGPLDKSLNTPFATSIHPSIHTPISLSFHSSTPSFIYHPLIIFFTHCGIIFLPFFSSSSFSPHHSHQNCLLLHFVFNCEQHFCRVIHLLHLPTYLPSYLPTYLPTYLPSFFLPFFFPPFLLQQSYILEWSVIFFLLA